MSATPLVTVIIPARDEAADIGDCLAAVADQTYPIARIEVLVVDGASTDGTREVAAAALAGNSFDRAEVITNEGKTTPSSLNVGLRHAVGEIICRVDARSVIPSDYVETCVDLLANPRIAVVGGAQHPRARDGAKLVERSIVRALRNPYTTGMARYRRGATSGATDTVYLGAFRRDELVAEHGWDERFLTNQDYELNRRMALRGLVWFDVDLEVAYRPRRTLSELASQYRRFGRWKAAAWLEGGVTIAPRQVALLLAPVIVGVGLVLAVRFRRGIPLAALGAAVVPIESAAGESASVLERVTSVAASGLVVVSWWCGTVEQAARYVSGQRLLAPPRAATRRRSTSA